MPQTVTAGVFPVHYNEFEIQVPAASSSTSQTPSFENIAGLENFQISIDNTTEEWYAMENEGWVERLLTGKAWAISFTGKRVIGDTGNDYIASKKFAIGSDAMSVFKWTLPDGTVIQQDVVIAVTNDGGGDSTNVGALEFELQSSGKPTVTPAA